MVIPNTITKIGAYAFSNCDQLRNIYIPSSVTEVGMSILYKCLNVNIYIEHLEIPDGWYRLWNDKIDGYKIKYGPYNS